MIPSLHKLPEFLILGAQKGGTTSLYRWLAEHPDFRSASTKEVHYFDNRYDQGLAWYRRHFPARWNRGAGTVTGEATPSYLFAPAVPGRVAETLPNARFVVLLRDPVKRAYSHYHHNVRMEREPRPFAQAVEEECAALDAAGPEPDETRFPRNAYVERGLYARQLERWFRHVDHERLMILFSEDLFARSAEMLARVAEFVGLAPRAWGDVGEERKAYNKYQYEPIDPAVAESLADWFRPHDEQLGALLDRPPAWR